ncbi:hypothetical protein EPI10_001341 [Gossypium australe]|uniref:Uncharacterized protein n=1 Tax=Gossypium australe TaxID=47621 RepID=A0A5B6VAL5_9ROSI|nr:hypothetical protein EPI10_001341 [Gossypium australe]
MTRNGTLPIEPNLESEKILRRAREHQTTCTNVKGAINGLTEEDITRVRTSHFRCCPSYYRKAIDKCKQF